MARLNEPPAPVESNFDLLRRKFLRQNRDLAKVNSNQSNRIRMLENECARLLSENLDLRGQVMRLEKEVENNSAQRIADHALEIRAKMEAQLAELGSMLASLGSEPPSKRHSPERRKFAKLSPRGLKSPAQRKARDPAVDQDALAAQEGRLPPIYENKTYPRATMNSHEIMALCAEAADTSNSPDLGPPPVSRFIDEEPVKTDISSRTTVHAEPNQRTGEDKSASANSTPLPKLDYHRKSPSDPELQKQLDSAPVKQTKPDREPESTKVAPQGPVFSTVRAGAKRKYGDENEGIKTTKGSTGKEKENSMPGGEKPRPIKELLNGKRPVGRPPLSAKSTNDDVSSPKKMPRDDNAKPAKPQQQSNAPKETVLKERKPAPIKFEMLHPEPTAPDLAILADPTEPGTPGPLLSPNTPNRSMSRDVACDTPPPGHLSVDGETSRPSRRARAAISYAEPNLRDKMRRPTKELFDAVSGEGKFKARQSISAILKEGESAPTSVSKSDGWRTGSSQESAGAAAGAKDATRRQSVLSPLVQRELQSMDMLPSSVVLERRKRPSMAGTAKEPAAESLEDNSTEGSSTGTATTNPTKPKQHKTEKSVDAMDIYEFSTSPAPTTESKDSPAEEDSRTNNNKPKRQARRASAAAHQALREYAAAAELEPEESTQQHQQGVGRQRNGHGRKRASMLAPKKSAAMDLLDGDYHRDQGKQALASASGEGGDDGDAALADRISRRRSMML
ncbi:hypothetical protein QBC47DRAFT_26283 [Echria macrotheca]|uniref:Shugoshin n=1 Tax=Echria macrotheca TaxID=438768 RepID=A0AAJ0FBQ2_9PEZI|nr:hypothetical protein QBC47DRAFT_26283 [Echria macrotheca]